MIVAGTHSKWGVERMVTGSTAEELIRSATCPVLTVGPNAKDPAPGPLVFRSIVYATDFSPEAAKAAAYALSFAQDSGAHLYLCYVIDPHVSPEPCEFLDAPFKAALKQLIPESVSYTHLFRLRIERRSQLFVSHLNPPPARFATTLSARPRASVRLAECDSTRSAWHRAPSLHWPYRK